MRWLCSLFAGASLFAQVEFLPVSQVRPGMTGVGKTVFSGSQVEEFQVEILGVLENAGPRQSLILARLSGGPLATTGVLQGMSGSPVYVGGRLVGAVAMAFEYSKEPIAAIRPIVDLIQAGAGLRSRARASLSNTDLTSGFAQPAAVAAGGGRLVDIATPVSFGGFAQSTLARFESRLRALGLDPRQGITGGGRLPEGLGKPSAIQPGSMISVQLLTGDMSVGADGTVTHIDGNRIYAFGHRFLSAGSTELPFARSEVLTLLPNLATSFKISAPREWMGTIQEDRSTGVAGELGRRAALIPVFISMTHHPERGASRQQWKYEMEMVDDSLLSPLLLQMALSSAIEATERTVGSGSLAVRGEIQLEGGTAPIRIGNVFSGESGLVDQASLAPAIPLAYAMQRDFETMRLKAVKLEIDSYEVRKQARIEQAWTSRREVRPGESVDLNVVLAEPGGVERTHKTTYRVPIGARTGTLYFTVTDGSSANTADYSQTVDAAQRSPAQLVSFLNSLRDNAKAYVRVWRQETNYNVQGHNLPSPPPSVEQILTRLESAPGAALTGYGSKVAEFELDAGGLMVTGSKTVQVEIKE